MHSLVCKIKPYIQPFERVLAFKEMQKLALCYPVPGINEDIDNALVFKINTDAPIDFLIENLTYWESIGEDDFNPRLTRQVKREATVSLVRNGIKPKVLQASLPFKHDVPMPNRRVLRYASHGIHEYRGKFFPQLVRSLLNATGIGQNSIVVDTMCGSGTTPVEAMLRGCDAIGIDYNPLSVLISKAKCDILSVDPGSLNGEYEAIKKDLLKKSKRPKNNPWIDSLPASSQKYLANWFSPEVLSDLDVIIRRVHETKNDSIRKFFLLSLSNIIRKVSWQKIDDLRVRKDVRLDIDIDPISEFIAELKRSFGYVLSFLYENDGLKLRNARIVTGDARVADQVIPEQIGLVDCIITSPPYATALPYLDTDRLSIYFMDLFERSEHRRHDLNMIGNREISNGLRDKLFEVYQNRKADLPGSIAGTIDQIYGLNQGTDAGFRRLNLPSLLSKYFFDMKEIFETYTRLLRPGAHAYVVVGNNHTIAGGQRVEIETDGYLAELGESVGLVVDDQIPMEMLVSRDIFRNNTGSAETIICFSKSQ
jgi:site-specific DNA-methyltransferase (cytosine-N4-specific)